MATPTFTSEAIAAIDALKNLKEPVQYVVCSFKEGTVEMDVVESGAGGVKNVRELLESDFMDKICTGAFQVTGVDDRGVVVSYRRKLVHFIWVGPEAKLMTKARVASQSGTFKNQFDGMQLYLEIRDIDELNEDTLETTLLSAGAAHKPTSYDFENKSQQEGSAKGAGGDEE